MTSIAESLRHGETILANAGVAEPRREAISLLALALNKDKTFIYAHPDKSLSTDERQLLESYLKRRANREPLQYISGFQEFYGLEFNVTTDVLIPRPETEMVVEHAVRILDSKGAGSFCEVGVGSGCIAVSILVQAHSANAVGLDVSRAALKVAQLNAEKHGVTERLVLMESDTFDSLTGERFDLIVSNPPYVPDDDIEGLQAEVRNFEPKAALAGGPDGLSIIGRIVDAAPRFLKEKGHLVLEIGFDQSEKVAAIFDPAVWYQPDFFPDLQGIPRMLVARRI